MKTSEFDFVLDKRFIAQRPLTNRTESKLMIVDKNNGSLEHKKFSAILEYLNENDTLVVNDTLVMAARLIGSKEITNAKIEIMLLKSIEGEIWETLVKPLKKIKIGTIVEFGGGILKGKCVKILSEGIIHVEFIYQGIFLEILDKLGEMPLPPYITEKLEDKDRYQTVYAKNIGSVAAPTAGLHFSKELLEKIAAKGIKIAYLTLHVGLGTFRPIKVDDIDEHKMHSEFYSLDKKNAEILKNTQGKIIAVGTTSTRTLETIVGKYGEFIADSGFTDIFIYPGYQFKAIDCLITNFHLPKSTLLMLVSALSSKKIMLNAYDQAIKKEYRFFSFGDSMLIR